MSRKVIVKRKEAPNNACTGRLGLCAFFWLILNLGSFPLTHTISPRVFE